MIVNVAHPKTALASSAYETAVLADSPAVYYRLNETSGTTASDDSGNGNAGTYAASGITYAATGALASDTDTAISTSGGTAIPVSAGGSFLPSGSTSRTAEIWAKTSQTGRYFMSWGPTSGDAAGSQFNIYLISATSLEVYTGAGQAAQVTSPIPLNDNAWHMYDFVYDGTYITFYIDGQQVIADNVGTLTTQTGSGLQIGNTTGATALTGSIDEPAIYPSALTATRINAHWRAATTGTSCPSAASSGYGGTIVADSPLAYYQMSETSGSAMADTSGNCHIGAYGASASHVAGAPVGDSGDAVSGSAVPALSSVDYAPVGAHARTLEAWGKSTASSFDLVSYGADTVANDFDFRVYNHSELEVYTGSGGGVVVQAVTNFDDGNWHHFAVTYDGATKFTFFADGQEIQQSSVSTLNTLAVGGLGIGNNSGTGTSSTDEVAIYNSALTPVRISAHWRASVGVACPSPPSGGYGAAVYADSPTRYYPFPETSGQVTEDYSGNCGPGAFVYGTTRGAGASLTDSNQSITGDGSKPLAVSSSNGLPHGSSAWTTEAWIKTTDTTPLPIFTWGTDVTGGMVNFRTYSSSLEVYTGNGGGKVFPGATLTDGTWHQVAVTYDGNLTMKAYLDGAVFDTETLGSALNVTDQGAAFGIGWNSPTSGFNGAVSDAAVYPAALSATRLLAHFLSSGHTLILNGGAVTYAQALAMFNGCLPCLENYYIHGSAGDPVNTASGNFTEAATDISIPGRSYPLAINRTYNSYNASVNGPFGYGWTFNYNMSLAVSGTSPNQVATISQENGSQATFNQPASGSSWPASAPRFIATLSYNSGTSTWTFVRQGRDTYTFNSSGQLTSETDRNGYTTTLSYTSGNLTTITDPASRTLTLGWTGGDITSLTDSNVSGNTRTVTYGYTGGTLTSVTDVNGGVTDFAYDGSHRMTLMRAPNFHGDGALGAGPSTCASTPTSHTVNNHYDGSGRVDCQWDAKGQKTTLGYSGDPESAGGGTTVVTDPSGNAVEDGYEYGLRTFEIRGYGTSAAATTSYTYDPTTTALTATMDPNGNVTTYTVDGSGNFLTVTDPLGHVTTNTYNGFNEILTSQDGNGKTTTNTYDGNGNLTSTSRPVTGTSCTCQVITYDHTDSSHPGDVTDVVDGDGKTTYFGFDGNGNRVETKDPLGNVSGSVFNADGWLTSTYSPKAGCTWGSTPPTGCSSTYQTQYSYADPSTSVINEFGDVRTVTDPLGHVTTYTYDADRNTTAVKDGNGNTTTNAYDAANELCWTLPGGTSANTCASPPTNARVTDYNSNGTVSDQKDGKGNSILAYGYDTLSRVTSTTDALSNVTTYVLDGAGNVLNKIDPGGSCTGTVTKCTTYTYDADNELKTVSYSDSSSENVSSTTYDGVGQRTAMTDGTGSSSWSFDNLHRLTSYTNGNSASAAYTYNLRNQPLTVVYPGSNTATYTYDNDGRMASLKDWLSTSTSTFGYDVNSNLTTDTLRNGVTDTYGFSAADQMTSVSDLKGTTTIFAATYTRDSNAQLASDSSQTTAQSMYKYTALNQLCYAASSTTNACGSAPSTGYPYNYDNADNLIYMENATQSGKNAQQFNAADELCWSVAGISANACSSPPTGATTFGYSTTGNRTSMVPSTGSATCYAYDQPNRMTQIQTGTGSTCSTPTTVGTYGYDGDGVRESKTVSGATTQFLYDGSGGNLLQEKAGSSAATNYLYGPGNLPVEQINGSTVYFYHHDQLGSTRALSSSTGAKKVTYKFDPYGSVVTCTNTTVTVGGVNQCTGTSNIPNTLMYSGQYRDDESGFYYLRARYYDPATGNFLTVDPALPLTRSPYGYAAGDPLSNTDPTGLFWVPPVAPAESASAACGATAEVPGADLATCGGAGVIWGITGLAAAGSFILSLFSSGPSYTGPPPSPQPGPYPPQSYIPPPRTLPAFPNAQPIGVRNGRKTWCDSDYCYQWDSQHGTVEKYRRSNGSHVGEYDPETGDCTGGPIPRRWFQP